MFVSIVLFLTFLILLLILAKIKLHINFDGIDNNIYITYLHVIKYTIYKNTKINNIDDNKPILNQINKLSNRSKHKLSHVLKQLLKSEDHTHSNNKIRILKQIIRSAAERKKIINAVKNLTSHTSITAGVIYTFFYSNPEITAFVYGIMNSLRFKLDFALCKYFKKNKLNLSFCPDFEKTQNNIDIKIILSVRIVDICVFGFKLLPIIIKNIKNMNKKGGAINGSSNRRLDENYNG